MKIRLLSVCLLSVALVRCDDSGEVDTPDTGPDVVQVDAGGGDAAPDVEQPDTVTEIDEPDVQEDAQPDVEPDVEPDIDEPDTPAPLPPNIVAPVVAGGSGSSGTYAIQFSIAQPLRPAAGDGATISIGSAAPRPVTTP
ncbi:MAG: hypothetical protein ACI81R_003518 [Bradymonadia bacterium]|jgi:hypothetical protein